ncbi:hypothetical protein [Streptomyces sp. NBC_00057]|uniref:hypothetical protein n=1 Tax=Streptomyces sp. NBC_00057 TaxID=2975634 RepID=UPI00324F2FC6
MSAVRFDSPCALVHGFTFTGGPFVAGSFSRERAAPGDETANGLRTCRSQELTSSQD